MLSEREKKDREEFDRVFRSEITSFPELSRYPELQQKKQKVVSVYKEDLIRDILEILDKGNMIIRGNLLDLLS
jgi:hypothetical protein